MSLRDGRTGEPSTLKPGPPADFVVRHYSEGTRHVEVGAVTLPAAEAAEVNRALVYTNFRFWPAKKGSVAR